MPKKIKQQHGLDAITEYVPGKPIEEVQREYGLKDVVKLASNENPIGASPRALAAIEKELPRLNLYPDGQSYYLRMTLAEKLGVKMEQITIGNGVDGLIMQTCMAYLDEESEVITSCSSFPNYDIYTHAMRAKLIKTPLKGFHLDLDGFRKAINSRTKIIFVCNPNNPTGTIVTQEEVKSFMEIVPEHVLVVFDEAYYEFVDSADYPDTLQYIHEGRKNVMVFRSFSKAYGLAGIRLGYAVAASHLLSPLNTIREPFAVNRLAQAAGIAALEDKAFLKASIEANRAGLNFLYTEMERIGLRCVESHTNFVLVEVGPHAAEIQKRLLEKGIIVRPCALYDLPSFLRITVGTHDENVQLIKALEELI